MKKLTWKYMIVCLIALFSTSWLLLAQEIDNNFAIIPEIDAKKKEEAIEIIKRITNGEWTVWDNYNKEYEAISGDIGSQFATGIMSRDTILDYIVYIIRFLSQIGLFIGSLMFIYAGYLYAITIFSEWWSENKGKNAIKYAVLGVLVVIFSYAIMRIFTSLFLGT